MIKPPLRRRAIIALLGTSLFLGCSNPGAGGSTATPGTGSTPGQMGTPVAKGTPGKVEVTQVKPGDGASVDGAGAVSTELKVWLDKFDGKPMGRGSKKLTLVPGVSELPGVLNALKGMKKGGVVRIAITGQDLFGKIPQGMPVAPDQPFFIEATVLDVFPTEPFDIKTTKPGSGDKAVASGDPIKVHYVGKLDGFDGKKVFDSSRERKQPFTVTVGVGQVIPGWDKGLIGMKKGEVRRLSIPHYLAYGDQARDKIPARSRLYFEVEMLDFVTPGELKTTIKKPGKGDPIAAGQEGSFHYTGWSDGFNGKQMFDSSRSHGKPFSVKLGAGQVIAGWDQGLVGMKPGEIRLLEIPYNLGYGERGSPPNIQPYATLYFEVEYMGLAPEKPAAQAPPSPTTKPTP